MKAKTIQYMSPLAYVNADPKFDRFLNSEPLKGIMKDLVNRGEISRYRGDETSLTFNDDCTIVEIVWNSRTGAEEYSSRLRQLDPLNKIVFKIDIEDVPET